MSNENVQPVPKEIVALDPKEWGPYTKTVMNNPFLRTAKDSLDAITLTAYEATQAYKRIAAYWGVSDVIDPWIKDINDTYINVTLLLTGVLFKKAEAIVKQESKGEEDAK